MPKIIPAQIIDVGRFKAFYFNSVPPRIETAIIFDEHSLSQKLVFQIMDITWRHGFGCAAPQFEKGGNIIFSVGTVLPSIKSLRRYSTKLNKCLEEVADFSAFFTQQLDFSILDISMFNDLDSTNLDLSLIAAVRDQQYGGDWKAFQKYLKENGREEEAQVIERCCEFERINKKDIGLIANKLIDTLAVVLEGGGAYQN